MLPLKLLGLLAAQRSLPDSNAIHKLLAGAATLILLSILTAFMAGGLLIGAFYWIHIGLINYGLTPDAAAVVVAGIAVLVTILLCIAICLKLNRMHTTIRCIFQPQSPIVSRLTEVVTSFADGLSGTSLKKRKK